MSARRCRAGFGGLAENRCDRTAVRPIRTRPKGKPYWCQQHAEQFDRVALELGYIKAEKFEGTPGELTDEVIALVLASPTPLSDAQLARVLGLRRGTELSTAVRAALESREIVARTRGATRVLRAAEVETEGDRPQRRSRAQQAEELARLVHAADHELTRDEVASALGIAPASVGHLTKLARTAGWLRATPPGPKSRIIAGDVEPPAVAA